MENKDTAFMYDTLYQSTKDKIEKLKNIQIDTIELEQKLYSINIKVEQEVSEVAVTSSLYSDSVGLTYINGIKELKRIQSIIDNYNFYFKLNNLLKLLKLKLDSLDKIEENELNIYVEEIKGYLTEIKTSSTINYKDEEKLIDELYEIAYLMIKKELLLKENSELLDFVLKSSIDTTRIDKLIHREVSEFDLKNNKEIASQIYKLDSVGVNSNYVDKNFIMCLAKLNYNNKIAIEQANEEDYKKLMEQLLDTKDKIDENEENTYNKYYFSYGEDNVSKYKKAVGECMDRIKSYKKEIIKSWISIFLSLTTLITSGFFLIPKMNICKNYKTTTYTYEDENAEPLIEEDYEAKLNHDKYVVYKEITPFEKNLLGTKYTRKITTYNLSDINLDNNKDYYDLDLEMLNRESSTTTSEKEQLTLDDIYEDTKKELTVKNQDYNDSIPSAGNKVLYVFLCCLLEILLCAFRGNISIFKAMFTIYSYKDKIKYSINEGELKANEVLLDNLCKDLKELISTNYQLKDAFVKTYQQITYKYGKTKEIEELYHNVLENDIADTIVLPEEYVVPKRKVKK